MQLFFQNLLPEIKHLDPDESKHCIKVLRKQVGDEIDIIDGKGTFYTAKITDDNPKKCGFEIVSTAYEENSAFHRHIAIAPTKNQDKMEWLVEKATEMGIDEISFFQSFHSERKVIKIERLDKKVISAMKQSLKARKPVLNEMISFNRLVENAEAANKLIAYVDFNNNIHMKNELYEQKDTLVLIGPEGDFTPEEVNFAVENGYKNVSLGNSRLRTETAALAAVHLMNLAME